MKKPVIVGLLVSLAVVLPGCITFAPGYPKDLLAFDEHLLGTWQIQANPDASPDAKAESAQITVERRDARMDGGKLAEVVPLDSNAEVVPAYRIRFQVEGRGDDTLPLPVLDAVLLEIDGVNLLATQISLAEPGVVDRLGWLMPVHRAFKIVRSGDSLTLASMKHEVVWMPIKPLDASPETARDPVRLPEEGGLWVVSQPARYVEVLKAAVQRANFWEESPVKLRRLAPGK